MTDTELFSRKLKLQQELEWARRDFLKIEQDFQEKIRRVEAAEQQLRQGKTNTAKAVEEDVRSEAAMRDMDASLEYYRELRLRDPAAYDEALARHNGEDSYP